MSKLNFKHVMVMGAGGVGGYFAGKLVQQTDHICCPGCSSGEVLKNGLVASAIRKCIQVN